MLMHQQFKGTFSLSELMKQTDQFVNLGSDSTNPSKWHALKINEGIHRTEI